MRSLTRGVKKRSHLIIRSDHRTPNEGLYKKYGLSLFYLHTLIQRIGF